MSAPEEGESSALQLKPEGHNEGAKASPASTPERVPSPVSDDTCPICLGRITDKCMANSCMHSFCLVCLKEWAKQKAVCPLCKLSFTSIMYDIKSERQYKEWKVPRPPPADRMADFQEYLDAERRRFFGYRTTNFPGAATLRRQHPVRLPRDFPPYVIPPGPRYWRSPFNSQRGTSMFRLSVYLNNVWVQPLSDVTGRYRESYPALYQEQPALTHRLVPWVNRELTALLPSSRIGVVLTEVMSLIEQHPINSRAFRQAMQSYLGDRTRHFAHEFYHYARSPYDMVGHDHASQYLPRYNANNSSSSSSSSSEEDAVVEVDQEGNPVAGPTVERQETLTQEGWVVISSDDSSSSTPDADSPTFFMGDTATDSFRQQQGSSTPDRPSFTATTPDFSATHNPEPPSRHSRERRKQVRSSRRTINVGASTSQTETLDATATLKREDATDVDTDECIIVEEVNKKLKTPEIIDIESESSDASTPKASTSEGKRNKEKGKRSSSFHHKEKLSKRKPVLKRNNFLNLPGPGISSSKQRRSQEDHSYCNEASSSRSGPMQNSSFEISLRWHNRSELSKSVGSLKKRQNEQKRKIANISSDSDSSSSFEHTKPKQKEQTKGSKLISKRDRISSHHRLKSPRRDDTGAAKRMKKDHRSKIKSSVRSGTNERHNLTSDDEVSAHNSDSLVTSTASGRTRSSWEDHSWNYSDESTVYCSSSHHSRTKSKKKKKRLKERRKSAKSKKNKKSKRKKKEKARKILSSSSSSSDTDSSELIVKRHNKRKSKVLEDSSSSPGSDW